ncbi:hypothetical protein V1460_28595 [Streptomyces sp. SCSIO 30461]|uniref:hypothetical protein n=1 Tax=Streptomyces sp. SCSIO 30461 TaxID=3118085 RepID=UPI0030D5B7BB
MTGTAFRDEVADAVGHALVEGPALDRVAGLPARSVSPLAAEPIARLLDSMAAARADLESLGPPVSELLYEAVPMVGAPSRRRAVLRWRRAAHGATPIPVPPALLAEVGSVLRRTGRDPSELHRWAERADLLRAHRSDLRQTATATRADQERALRALMSDPVVARGLSVVSPVFFARTAKDRALDRGERVTAYGYAVRTALKTSPLSSLTHVAVPGAGHGDRVRVSLHPLVGRILLHTAAARPEVRDRLVWRPNDSLRGAGDDARLSVPLLSVSVGWAWSHQELVDARRRLDLSSVVGGPADTAALGQLPVERLERYLASGLVDVDDPCPPDGIVSWLAGLLASAPDVSGRTASARLTEVAGHLGRIADGTPAQRSEALRGLRSALTAALRELGAPDDWPLSEVTLVYEDCAGSTAAHPLDGAARAAVLRHAESACASLRISDEYQAVTDAFVARFGVGGVCKDVFAFCRDVAGSGPSQPVPPAVARTAGAGRSSCLPCLSVLYQDAHGSEDGALVVVNQISSGSGALAARFHRLFDGPDRTGFADRLRDWIATLHPQAECLEFVPAREASPLQADSGGLLPALYWPGTPRPYGPGTPVTELELAHDPDRHALELRRPGAGPVAPVYLGTVPRHLVGGAARVLLTLADPWWLTPGRADGARTDGPTSRGDGFLPRRSIGRAVVRRAHWRCDSSEVPRQRPGEDWPEFLERMDGWRRAQGMPAEVYARCETDFPRHDALRKPLWVAFASPVGLEALHRLTERPAVPVVFTECLPDRGDPTSRADGQGRVVEHCVHFARATTRTTGRC